MLKIREEGKVSMNAARMEESAFLIASMLFYNYLKISELFIFYFVCFLLVESFFLQSSLGMVDMDA